MPTEIKDMQKSEKTKSKATLDFLGISFNQQMFKKEKMGEIKSKMKKKANFKQQSFQSFLLSVNCHCLLGAWREELHTPSEALLSHQEREEPHTLSEALPSHQGLQKPSPRKPSRFFGVVLLGMVLEMLVITTWERHKIYKVKSSNPLDMIIGLNVPRKASSKLL